jgi:hypothetical protein
MADSEPLPSAFEPFLFTSFRRKSSIGTPASPGSVATRTTIEGSSPRSRKASSSFPPDEYFPPPPQGRRRTSLLSFLSTSSRKTSCLSEKSTNGEEEPLQTPTVSTASGRRGSRWSRSKKQKSVDNTVEHAMPCMDEPRAMPSHEMELLDRAIPEGTYEDEEPPTALEGSRTLGFELEWFSCEEDAQKRTEEIMSQRERGSGHWLHSTGLSHNGDDGSGSEGSLVGTEGSGDAKLSSGTPGTRFLGRLGSMAGLGGNSAASKRDRAGSLPTGKKGQRKAKEEGARRSRAKSTPTSADEKRRPGAPVGVHGKGVSGAEGMVKPPSGGSVWDSLRRKKGRAMSIFGGRGEYTGVATN